MRTILIIDDEEYMRWVLKTALSAEGYEVLTAESGEAGLEIKQPVDLVVLDLKLPGISGIEVLPLLKERQPSLPVIVITAHGTIDTAISAMKKGADDFITKPFEMEELLLAVRKSLEVKDLVQEVNFLRRELKLQYGLDNIMGQSEKIQAIRRLVGQAAPSDASILLTGESGTGKEIVARAIHECSECSGGPFVAVNCGAIPENLLEAELFGYEKGAFTGAVTRKQGRFELAHRGTLFLDEVGEMPLAMQVKFLRFLQELSLERVGGNQTIKVDVRIVAATNKDLAQAIKAGSFREDLYYRLNVLGIELPPLRERREDIPVLAEYFLTRFRGNKPILGLSPEALKILEEYDWPGNVRELENVIQRATILCQGEHIKPGDLPPNLGAYQANIGHGFTLPSGGISLEEVEKDFIVQALEKTSANQSRAAELLGITRSALIYRMQKYGLH